jgi:CheY-like chemotaxis protein
VADDPLPLKALSGLRSAQGLQPLCLLLPVNSWKLLQVVKPALLLLDLAMPDCDGIKLCKTVRQDATYRDLPILVITIHSDAESIQQAFAAGADEVFSKPVAEDMLLTRIKQYLTRRRITAPTRELD